MAQAGEIIKCPNCGTEATLDDKGNPPEGWRDSPFGYYCPKTECNYIGLFGPRDKDK